jgi:hypothetical protein
MFPKATLYNLSAEKMQPLGMESVIRDAKYPCSGLMYHLFPYWIVSVI